MRLTLVITAAATIALANALELNYDRSNDFDRVDSNSDGFISLPEFLKWRNSRLDKHIRLFKSYDTNADGHLSVNEFVPLVFAVNRPQVPISEKLFRQLDNDKDGILTRDEAISSDQHIPNEIINGLFQVADKDLDDRITLSEFMQVVESPMPSATNGIAQSLFSIMDVNGDGRISTSEVRSFVNKLSSVSDARVFAAFRAMDTNSDHFLSISELEAHPSTIPELAGIQPMPDIL